MSYEEEQICSKRRPNKVFKKSLKVLKKVVRSSYAAYKFIRSSQEVSKRFLRSL
jgi:hypothetical protein